jgi:LDH2 family malate/lactate/ureidoglycolate dehydrogenase
MRHSPDQLIDFAAAVLEHHGLARQHSVDVANTFVEADLLGYSTHGLAMLPMFVALLQRGTMTTHGEPTVIARHQQHAMIDGQMLPGPVVMRHAVQLALELAQHSPLAMVNVCRSSNTACLATYLPPIAADGYIAVLYCATSGNAAVAPPGAASAVYGTDPIAACIPTDADPILFDFATSATTNRMTERARRADTAFDFNALVDNQGKPSADVNSLMDDPPGAIAPMGGADSGHKGFALALLNEALTGALSGHGRAYTAQHATPVGSAMTLQIIDPEDFAGLDIFKQEMAALRTAVANARPALDTDGPRLPGQRAFAARREQLAKGIELHADIPPLLNTLSEQTGIAL